MAGTTYAPFRDPFLGLPTLRSHIHPHLLIFNLGDKIESDPDAAWRLIFYPDPELCALAQDVLSIHEIWMEVQPRRAAGFCADKSQAASPAFTYENDGSHEDICNWDAPRPRTCDSSSRSRPRAYMEPPNADYPDDEYLDSMDSGNFEQLDWWLRPSSVNKLWLKDLRRWQAASATGAYEYHAPWEELDNSLVFEVCDGALLLYSAVCLTM